MKTTDRKGNNFPVVGEAEGAKHGPDSRKFMGILISFIVIIWLMFSFGVVQYDMSSRGFNWSSIRARVFGPQQTIHNTIGTDSENFPENKTDKLLGGLLLPGFDEKSCISRYNSALYRKPTSHFPSPPLISKLRAYESLHKRCGPGTLSYRKALENLNSGKQSGPSDCNYIVWISFNGLGNRILTLASTFLYALLTNRVVLVDRAKDMTDLFCEPFPDTSWLIPEDFPLISKFDEFNQKSKYSYGNMLKANVSENFNDTTVPSLLYLYEGHGYDDWDKLFFCEQNQYFFKKVPWLIIKTDNYFIPSLFLMPSFEQELNNLFPRKESIFHLLGRYLFHPTNQVWGLITRFYEAYLENSDEKIGVQIRLLEKNPDSLQYVFDQISSCLVKETKLIPGITKQEHNLGMIKKRKTKSILVTSLYSSYYEKLRDMYWENPTTTGEIIRFYQPSYEKYEQNKNKNHNMKAWAEIYLLSLTDKLVTSSWSTFGYVAQGLGGLRPWILYKAVNQTAPDPPCHRGVTIEPCSHLPSNYDCRKKTHFDPGSIVPHVRPCEDMSWGIKLVDVEK